MLEDLRPVFGTRQTVLPIHTTGRGGLEASICNLFSPGDRVVACCNGKFGEMWAGLAEAYGLVVRRIATDWQRSVSPEHVEAAVREHKAAAVLMTYCDTANGVLNDVKAIGRVTTAVGALLLVDGISSLGGVPFQMDEWGVDVAVTASQKCLMSSPGLAFAVLSERAWAAGKTSRLPRSYWDLAVTRQSVTKPKPEPPGTAPVHIVLQVVEALAMMKEEGLDAVFRRHEQMASRVRSRVGELGLELQCPDLGGFSPTVTAIALPEGVAPKTVRDPLKERGILTAGGLGQYEPSGFRIGHMGDIRMTDVDRTLDALAEVLAPLGVR